MRARRLRLPLAISIAAVAATACAQLVGFESIAYEPADASSDRSAIDAGDGAEPPKETGADADGGEAAAPCVHDFCDDFEGAAAPDQRWTGKEIVGTGELTLVDEDGGTNTVMRSAIARPDGSLTAHIARVSLQGPATTKPDGTTPKIRVAFRLKVEAGDRAPYAASIAFIVIGSTPTSEDVLGLELAVNDADPSKLDVFIRESYGTDAGVVLGGKPSSLTIRKGEWTDVELQVNARPPGVAGGATVTIDGMSDSYGLASNSRAPYLRVDVGHGYGGASGAAFTSFFDDVRIDYK